MKTYVGQNNKNKAVFKAWKDMRADEGKTYRYLEKGTCFGVFQDLSVIQDEGFARLLRGFGPIWTGFLRGRILGMIWRFLRFIFFWIIWGVVLCRGWRSFMGTGFWAFVGIKGRGFCSLMRILIWLRRRKFWRFNKSVFLFFIFLFFSLVLCLLCLVLYNFFFK